MKKYTVILIYPDHVAENYGEEFYTAYVEAKTPKQALAEARAKALTDNSLSSDPESDNFCDAADFACVAMFEGHHDVINPED